MTRAIAIPVDGDVREVELSTPPTLEELKTLVGGWLEAIPSPYVGNIIYLNEEGKLLGLPINVIATQITRGIGLDPSDLIVGDVVLIGGPDSEGYDTDVTVTVEDVVSR